jgi:ABC transport system ATP-binding/permease protein
MNLLSMDRVAKTLKDAPLFSEVSLGIESGDKIGLVGRNGCGKSTLLKLVSGALEADSGNIARNRGLRVASLEQSPSFVPGMDLAAFLLEGDSPAVRLVREYEACLASHEESPQAQKRLAELHRRMEEEGGFTLEHRYQSFLSELGIDDPRAPMATLSGGMVKKAAIARCLASGADLVLLDEPTNHLDIETIEWLESKLKCADFAFVLVTHDRYFLEGACTTIMEIDRASVFTYPGSYGRFLEKRAERYASYAQADARRISILRDELEWLKRGPKARGGKSKSRKQRIKDMVDARPERETGMESFSVGQARLGKKVLELADVAKSFGPKRVIEGFSYVFSRGDKIGIIGPNGAGKTTLLNMIAGILPPDSGSVDPGDNTVFAYFDQDTSKLDKSLTVLEFMKEQADRVAMGGGFSLTAEQFLERFLFPRSSFDVVLSKLSGGELRRLQLIRLLASGCNFLLLDEPTNDFDIDTISLLEDFLIDFPGCLLTISHDRAFLDRVTDGLFVFDGKGGLSGFVGDYSDFRDIEAERLRAKSSERKEELRKNAPVPGAAEGKKKLSYKERQELDGLLGEIESLEKEKAELEALFASGSGSGNESLETGTKRYAEVLSLIETASERWLSLSERA